MTAKALFLRSVGLLLALSLGGQAAEAQLSNSVQKCLDLYNNRLRLVAQQKGMDDRACVKKAGTGSLPDPDACIGAVSVKTQKTIDKVTELYLLAKCTGSEPIQQGAAVATAAQVKGVDSVTHSLFGDPLSGVVSPGSAKAKCQDQVIQRAMQLFDEKMKAFRKCKKDGMHVGTVSNSATLETQCLTPSIPDPTHAIAEQIENLLKDVKKKCGSLTLASVFHGFSGSCVASPDALATCIDQRIECAVCETLNAADGTARDCDQFDDGVANVSCGLSFHTCVLDTSSCSAATNPACGSRIQMHLAALPTPLVYALSGTTAVGAADNRASCRIQNINPINIPAIGFICLSSGPPCPNGSRQCGPGAGPALGVDVESDGNAGTCTSQAQCQTTCSAACGASAPILASCTGHCVGTTASACTTDAQCIGLGDQACAGPDPVTPAEADICQCSCLNAAAFGPSDAGDMQCFLSTQLLIEMTAPCDGTGIVVDIGSSCIPVSSERATASIVDADFVPGSTVPKAPNVNDQTGTPLACAIIDTGTTTGLTNVGAANFFGSRVGDISVGLSTRCQ